MASLNRAEQLIYLAAQAMEDGCDPFDHAFLREHAVTLEEVMSLGAHLGQIARGYLRLPKSIQAIVQLMAASEGTIDFSADVLLESMFQSYYQQKMSADKAKSKPKST